MRLQVLKIIFEGLLCEKLFGPEVDGSCVGCEQDELKPRRCA